MKVLWFSNIPLTETKLKGTGSWLYSMSRLLVENGVDLYNITQGDYNGTHYYENDLIKEWRIQRTKKYNNYLPEQRILNTITDIVERIKPDLFHVWGMEEYWGLLFTRGIVKGRVILDIQGIKKACSEVYYGNLQLEDIISTIGPKELIMPHMSILKKKREFEKWGCVEAEMLSSIKNISIQSEWVHSHIKPFVRDTSNIYKTKIILRPEFEFADQWKYVNTKNPVITTIFNQQPFKGFYILLKAVSIVKTKYPNVRLDVIGNFYNPSSTIRRPGYISYLIKLIKKYGITDNVNFLGPLDACQIIKTMQSSQVMVQTSFCESYSMALAESMAVGIPCVVAFAGAMPELAKDREEALFYPPYDPYCCASLIERVIIDKELAGYLSDNSRRVSVERNDKESIVNTQLNIYNKVMHNIK